MSQDDAAAHRVANAIAAQDPLLGRDLMAAALEYLSRWGIESWDQDHYLNHGTLEIPRILRLQAFSAALAGELGDERSEGGHAFVVRTPESEYQNRDEAGAREVVHEYAREHGEEAARRDLQAFLHLEATGTSHEIAVERLLS